MGGGLEGIYLQGSEGTAGRGAVGGGGGGAGGGGGRGGGGMEGGWARIRRYRRCRMGDNILELARNAVI